MSWPKTGAAPRAGVLVQGVTTIEWGTEDMFGVFVVLRYSQRQLVTNDKLPQGSGLTSTRVQTIDGAAVDLTVRDDTTMTPPAAGTTLSIVDGGGLFGAVGTSYTCRVTESGWDSAPKQAGERSLTVEKLILVD